ncbi:hypothetical protein Taro_018126 [Colocasia esculenta]|uniref:Gustatory receptor n=1 Tax=Colocasia esculenta TaxID=4460 RepID=A0A843UHZ0_COLES|nr:hypothetical protein [Colocasia esculenta]
MAMNPVTVTVDHPREAGGGDDHGLPGRPAELTSSAATMATPLLLNPAYARTKSLVSDELRNFRISLKWCALDHSSPAGRVVSYVAFATLALAVPAATSLAVRTTASEAPPSPINRLVQLPTSALAAISFFTLFSFFRRYGLRQLLFLDGLREDSGYVRRGYTHELDRAFKYLTYILLPSFSIELAHKVVFFAKVSVSVPFQLCHGAQLPCNSIAFLATLASWVYRTGVFLLVCVLFRLTCELQILRLQGFRKLLEGCGSDAGTIFKEHARIRRQLLVTSHRYRVFIICCFVVITISQLGALLLVLSSKAQRNFFNSGDLLVCSVVQLSGFLMCLLGAARITHRAQGVVAIAAWWHMTMTSSAAAAPAAKSPLPPVRGASVGHNKSSSSYSSAVPLPPVHGSASVDHKKSSLEQYCSAVLLPPPPAAAADYTAVETRKALVEYLQHNSKGITLFGYALDRGLLHTLFAFEMSLLLWILSKVVVLS